MADETFDYDVIVIGSGFGGSVSSLRLTEKGYKIAVLEAGPRYRDEDFAKTSWRLRKFVWFPPLGMYGIQRVNILKDSLILSGAGVGGGSLVYANTLYEPLDAFYRDPQWGHITDWKSELAPYYDQAKRMFGVTLYPRETAADRVIKQVADQMGVGGTFHHTPVGVVFGDEPGANVGDPYFGGVGPDRNACLHCGECMTGCRHNAKNTLVKNYLYLAEKNGAEVFPLTTATKVRPLPGGGYAVETRRTNGKIRRGHRTFTAEQVVFAAATMGTHKLLHKMKDQGVLPNISERLGVLTRTNSEALLGAIALNRDVDYTDGVAITSSFHPNDHTHIEPVRYGRGSNAMAALITALVPGDLPGSRIWRWVKELGKLFIQLKGNLFKIYDPFHWSEKTVIALVMQTHDNSITTLVKRKWWRLGGKSITSKQGHGRKNPDYIPEGHEAVRRMAEAMGGKGKALPGGTIGEPFGIPMTAHFMGGAVIGDGPETGVIDPYHRVYGHPGLHVVDGAAISANLGVNPSLTISAQAERALSLWPNKDELDPRPELGQAYRRITPVAPKNPIVPDDAPAAYRLPIV
jgi:cholesterol oxidase